MTKVNISKIATKFAPYSYTVKEIVDDFLPAKIDKEVRDFVVEELGIDRVYKSFDLEKIDWTTKKFQEPSVFLNDLYVELASDMLAGKGYGTDKIDFLITINDFTQYLDPSPTVELVSRLGLSDTIRTQNVQGLACSSFSEAVLNSAGNFLLNKNDRNALVLIGSQYSPWFLDSIKLGGNISRYNRRAFHNLVYFLIFSDVVAGCLVTSDDSNVLVEIEHETIVSRKDSSPDGYKKAILKLAGSDKDRVLFDMMLDPVSLKNTVGKLCKHNIKHLSEKFPGEFQKVKAFGFHTAGARFIDHVISECEIDRNKSKLSYSLMKNTGNTGAASSLQFIEQAIKRNVLSKGDLGCYVDYGWEGADSFLFKIK